MHQSTSAASDKNICSNTTVLTTTIPCHSCSISALVPCTRGFKRSPNTLTSNCQYHVNILISIKGCSFQCYKEVEQKHCCPGYWGDECIECPEQAAQPCSNNGICSDGRAGNGTCSCKVGFVGTACEDCADNLYGPTCSSELPECTTLHCQLNSRCIEDAHTGKLGCQCQVGYQAVGVQCISMNPCLQQVCHAHATCTHVGPGKHTCTCNQGYRGDGHVCMPIDPCQTDQGGCSTDSAQCVYDGPGKSRCKCLPGFDHLVGGVSCSVRDACRPDSCSRYATCSTTGPGTVECTCRRGYMGNGKVCYGNIMERLRELNTEPGEQWRGQLSNAITLFDSLSWPLSNLGPFTVFVPINKGFKGLSLKTLMADTSKSKYLVKLHMVAGEMPFDTLKRADIYYTLTGKAGETDNTEGDMQTKIRIHGSRKKAVILQSDVAASNGMIHIINKLMDSVSPTVDSDQEENLMKILSDYGKFSQFKTLLEKASLSSVMDQPGPYTVFAPVNTAFDNMKDGYLAYLSSSEGSTKLLELLRNHIVPSTKLEVYNAVSDPRTVTLANQLLLFNVTTNGQILVNGMAVLETDVEAKNGRLYLLDGVLIPASIEPVLPHRCDTVETRVVKDGCYSCSKVARATCSSGAPAKPYTHGQDCSYTVLTYKGQPIFAQGCSFFCNQNVTTSACCKGFYGSDCSPCPGGFQTPCSGNGQCAEGLDGNGTCFCKPNFSGSRCQYCASSNKYGPSCDQTCDCIHGQCDNRPGAGGGCKQDSCQSGYVGRYCERQTRVCGVRGQFCHAHADCDFSSGESRCVCKAGFRGDGITCVETDPCAPPLRGGCSLNAKCITTGPATHTCQCLAGWKEDGEECQPINDCLGPDRGGCHPNATCIYIGPGQSDCACKSGFRGNGVECEAMNRCVTEKGGCHYLASCRYLSSEWKCVCDDEYVGNGEVCYGTVEQELMTLPDVTQFIKWVTGAGLSPSLSEGNVTLLVPSSTAIDKMSSEETDFWTSPGNLPSIVKNHIIQGNYPTSKLRDATTSSQIASLLKTPLPVSSTNESTIIGGATITTEDISATNGVIHIIDKVLMPERKQSEGLLELLALRPEFSLFRSYLIQHDLAKEIWKAGEYTVFAPTDSAVNDYLKKMAATAMDVNLTRYHIVPSEKLLKTDLQGGGYKQTMLGFSFQLGIFPRDGKLFVNEAQVNVSNIVAGQGVVHGLSAVLEINRNRCDKETFMTFAERKCCSGYFGKHCEPCPGPKGQPCFGNGMCVDGINGTGVCQCNKDFNGTACETCPTGKYGIHCDQVCACNQGRCKDGMKGDGTCECDVGWRGINCHEKIVSKEEELCGSVKCHTSANCIINQSGVYPLPVYLCVHICLFVCCGVCTAKDACAVGNGGCSLNAVCKKTLPGRRDCVCTKGYSGDGLVCVEINPCLEGNGGCPENTECIHTGPNKTSCTCSKGFSGDGQKCRMIDLCRKKNGECHRYAKCNMTAPGVRTCTCGSNYIGDGVTCKGTVLQELLTLKLRDFYLGLMVADISLRGRGPFTVFAPNPGAFTKGPKMKRDALEFHKERVATILRYHIVPCHTLLPSDLTKARNLTSLTGDILMATSSEGNIFLNNKANVTFSDTVSTNGIIHEIDTILVPESVEKDKGEALLNLTDVADLHGYKTFYKLLEDTGVMDNVNLGEPVTVLLPSDQAMAALATEQKDFLYNEHNRAELVEYLKFHILSQTAYATELIHLDHVRTLQGSELKFSCGGLENVGEIFINGGKCRVIQRHLLFRGGMAYGLDCLLAPPSLGGRCDSHSALELTEVRKCDLPLMYVSKNKGCQSICVVNLWNPKCCAGYSGRDCLVCPGGAASPCGNHGKCDDGHLGNGTCQCDAGFRGVACDQCGDGHFGPACNACNCTEHGSCDEGVKGTGSCFCEQGWTGQRCETQQAEVPVCSPPCSPNGVCKDNACVCKPFYEGDGQTCTVADLCQFWNGGCATGAKCSQKGEKVSCTCPRGHSGDGFSCQPMDPCASEENGGCHEHATCTMTGPGKKKCSCKDNYVGDGVSCEAKDVLINRCIQDNGQCHQDAQCTDLHFEDSTVGVFHFRSTVGQYKLNYTAALEACNGEGATLATYTQLSYAQQAGFNLCAAGWLDQARVAYPTTYSNPKCGFGHVGIVDYGPRGNLSETWDAYCYRVKEVKCECNPGYIGDGYSCTGNILQVLSARPAFSNFLTQILNYSEHSETGRHFANRLSNLTLQATLFVPDNSGLSQNQTLTHRDIEYHLSEGRALALQDLKNGSQIRTRLGPLTVLGLADFLNPKALSSSRYINDRFVTESDILASNGIIHVLQGPLKAPPPQLAFHVGHKASMGVGVVLLVILIVGVAFVGYHFYTHKTKPFNFHYFKEEEEDEGNPPDCNPSICNPMYDAGPDPSEPASSDPPEEEDKHQVVNGGPYDLLQDS
ncbi:stabilin-2 [Aplochiton taeniatus]